MAPIIPKQWLDIESDGFDRLFDITSRCCDAFERLTALNLQTIRFAFAETQESIARTGVANNLPEVLCLQTLLAPAGFAQALSYSRQFFEIMSAFPRDSARRQPHLANVSARTQPISFENSSTVAGRAGHADSATSSA